MLLDILKNKECFKLICGAGNENTDEVEKLVTLYSLAGCQLFDVCAKREVIEAAKTGLQKAGNLQDRYICISVGSESDQHFSKAEINQEVCTNCLLCEKICPQNAINHFEGHLIVNEAKCIGCKRCIDKCPQNAFKLIHKKIDYNSFLPSLIKTGIDCIEFHVFNDRENSLKKWNEILSMYEGILSISINRTCFGDEETINLIKAMLDKRQPYTTIIQADGIPMSGGKDTFNSTLQAISTADLFASKNLPAYIVASGGTNSKTSELANLCGVELNGVAIGSFARKIVKEYIEQDDFWTNEQTFAKALSIAKNLVEVSKNNLK